MGYLKKFTLILFSPLTLTLSPLRGEGTGCESLPLSFEIFRLPLKRISQGIAGIDNQPGILCH
jgi:hypothetical protein